MQCLPTLQVVISCATELETFVQGAVIKTDKGLCHGAEGGRLSWWFGDAWSGCPVAQPRLPMQCLPGFDCLMSSAGGDEGGRG